jgi:hypothetical protein
MTAGGGHHALRDSFHHVLRTADPARHQLQPVAWDSPDRLINWFYSFCVHHLTKFQGRMHELSTQPWTLDVLTSFSPALLFDAYRVLKRERPSVVVSTHFMLTMMFVKAKLGLGLPTPIVTAIPDYGAPTFAFNPPQPRLRPDRLLVMAEDTYRHYVQTEGVDPAKVHLSGFVTRAPFVRVREALTRRPEERSKERARILDHLAKRYPQLRSLRPQLPTLLFTGGSAWTRKTDPVLDLLARDAGLSSRLNLVVVSGKDARFHEDVKSQKGKTPHLAVFEHVPPEDYAELMGLADFPVLGSLAPASMQELLETGCGPLLLFHFIPGTERPHVAHIERERIGLYEPDPKKMLDALCELSGLTPQGEQTQALARGFSQRARELRASSIARAYQLPTFLAQVVDEAFAPARSGQGATRLRSA